MSTRHDLAEQAHPDTPPPATEPPTDPTPPAAAEPPTDPTPPAAASGAAVPDGDAGGGADKDPATEVESGAGTGSGGETSRGGRFTRAKVLGALGAMLVAAIAATAVLQWVSAAQAQDARAALEAERSLRLEVSGAASAFSRALLSYDYKDLQTTRSTLAAQATGDFLATYDTAFGGAMAQVIVKLEAVSQATVREVYLSDVDEATAHAIVVVDQQVNTSEAIRSVTDSHLKISLVKEKGSWKINDVTVLGAASEDQYNLDGDKKKD
ncbi:hypothetical protein [Nonomuraea insulae]|uniref:Mce-associated membrane protein n=1 Tax=Nonomuraea insulae TaxID=1616787 RepID=A0ABW1D1U6_9ACTN